MDRTTTKRRGFTLLELLVAMTLMTILAASLYSSLYIGFKARQMALRGLVPTRSATLAVSLLREDLASVLPPTGLFAGEFLGTDDVDEAGVDADTLSFYSCGRAPGPEEGRTDIVKVELALANLEDTGERALVRRITTNLLPPETVEPYEEVLCRGVRSLNVTYFDGLDWYDEWDSTLVDNALPVAVDLTLEMEAEDAAKAADPDALGPIFSQVVQIPCYSAQTQGGTVVNLSSPGR